MLTAWLQVQAPTGIAAFTNDTWALQPTVAFGKGWGRFDVQATVGGVLPIEHTSTLGNQAQTNVALQYHLGEVFWPELEANWTYYGGGQRNGLNQLYLTPGLVVGRFQLNDALKATFGPSAIRWRLPPDYRAKPLTPAYDHAWIFSSRINF